MTQGHVNLDSKTSDPPEIRGYWSAVHLADETWFWSVFSMLGYQEGTAGSKAEADRAIGRARKVLDV